MKTKFTFKLKTTFNNNSTQTIIEEDDAVYFIGRTDLDKIKDRMIDSNKALIEEEHRITDTMRLVVEAQKMYITLVNLKHDKSTTLFIKNWDDSPMSYITSLELSESESDLRKFEEIKKLLCGIDGCGCGVVNRAF